MQPAQKQPAQPQPVKIYNAVYSSVQVYECMVRGIAVMRRRADSYVNATQILKVAGVDKGRRTKILEKEILPGKHEIVQGGYGKYQGTWIPLERGRDIALQYGVAPLLSPLFDFVPSSTTLGAMSSSGNGRQLLHALLLSPPSCLVRHYVSLIRDAPKGSLHLPPPSTKVTLSHTRHLEAALRNPLPRMPLAISPTPPPMQGVKRTRSDADGEATSYENLQALFASQSNASSSALGFSPDIQMADVARPSSAAPPMHMNGEDGPSPSKRARTEPPHLGQLHQTLQRTSSQLQHHLSRSQLPPTQPSSRTQTPTPQHPNGIPRSDSSSSLNAANNHATNGLTDKGDHKGRFASRPLVPRNMDPAAPLKDYRRTALVTTICQRDDPNAVLDLLREIPPDNPNVPLSVDVVLDDLGHTALHIAASVGRLRTVDALLASGADVHRGNYNGETPLIRACLVSNNFDQQSFGNLVAPAAPIFLWIAQQQDGDFRSIVDLQDEHGDTALNIAARVGNRSLVRTLLDVGANRILPNKLGLRPGDFGVENEELGGGPRVEDLIASLRSGPSAPAQKSQDVIADMTSMIQGLSTDFSSEIKTKQDALDVTQAHLRAATRELSEQRKQIQAWQARCAELDQVNQRRRNIEKALADEDTFDWTGRTDVEGAAGGPAFQYRGKNSTMAGLGGILDVSFNLEAEPTIPLSDSVVNLVRLRRLKMWHERMDQLMEARLKSLHGASAEREFQCKKIVALCTGVPVDRVEEMLDDLVIAVESETQVVDIGRVSGFMQKVRDGVI
ncbi:hypothetical protein EVG20_g8232 [Dentipellis fragilis]|uniref:HTH APSES-type domain-containing protein n=1 Tax=Dentipellis fragilis TaxID=205917 RepID=A0A4Y9Y6T0_9AGAM|nr:hypothetical protein EVG20_g8232 [Dentipellis fragilis]